MNEADTRAELIDPKIKEAGWGKNENLIRRAYKINTGEIKPGGTRESILEADYVLTSKDRKVAVIEAKKSLYNVRKGIAQAKLYAKKLNLLKAYAANGKIIYEINFNHKSNGEMYVVNEGEVKNFSSPKELNNIYSKNRNEWTDKFDSIQFATFKGGREPRYYQEIAINNALEAISKKKGRILLTLATGTGKTVIAFHIAWKLFHARWNKQRDGKRTPRILFLADRNILANQAFNSFGAFEENALARIKPNEISKKGSVPTNASIFFTIYQTFMSGPKKQPYFGQYPKDFFDLIIIDECHRGGSNDESNWRDILNYFSSAVQVGLTATPKREINADTYKYFGEPIYIYPLKEGIEDGYLTPFKVIREQTTMDEYIYDNQDEITQGEIKKGKIYKESDINKLIEIEAREKKRVELMLSRINNKEKTLVFCANQDHALLIRDLIMQCSVKPHPEYCVRVTADEGEMGDTYLRQFQDNDKNIPTILTTSHKLSTGVDALNIRNIVLMREIKTMIEFKQIIGRGTRIYEGKNYFTIVDFVGAHQMFQDPDWDGDPIEPPLGPEKPKPPKKPEPPEPPKPPKEKIKVKLSDNREREIKNMSTTFYYFKGKTLSFKEFLQKILDIVKLPDFFNSEEELRKIWSSPITRNELLKKLQDNEFDKSKLKLLQTLVDADDSDLFDVLQFIAYNKKPISRKTRVANAENKIHINLNDKQKEFIDFVLSRYVEGGVEELDVNRLSDHITLKYKAIYDGEKVLGNVESIKNMFINFQKHLY